LNLSRQNNKTLLYYKLHQQHGIKMKTVIAVLALTLCGCTTYNGYPALIPLPTGNGPLYGGGAVSNSTAYVTTGTITVNGVSKGYSVTVMGK
jgi:hypothetical protein